MITPPTTPRVALCLEYSIFQFGGTEVLVAELIRQLAADFDLTLVSADRSVAATWVEPLVKHHICWDPGTDWAAATHALIDELQAKQIGIVHFHFGWNYAWNTRRFGSCPVMEASRRGLKCLITNHGFFSGLEGYCAMYRPLWMKLALLPVAWISKIQVVGQSRGEIAVSKHDWRALQRWYPLVRGRFHQIYHSKLPANLPPSSSNPRIKRIVCVGTIGARKGQHFLLRAFSLLRDRYPDWRLEILGRSADEQVDKDFKALLAELNLGKQFEWTPGLTDEQIADRLGTSEIFAMPSLYEGLGLSLQEALFHGCACIASRAGGITDLIEHNKTGILVEPGNVESLRAGLERLMNDPEFRARLRTEGPAFVRRKRMSAPEMADAYRRFYRSLL